MRVKVQETDATDILSLEGDLLGEADYRKLRGRVCDLVEHGRKDLVLDLTHVEHINSCGLEALVCAFTTAWRAGGELQLTGAGVHVRKTLRITHLDKVFQIYPSVSAARRTMELDENLGGPHSVLGLTDYQVRSCYCSGVDKAL